MSEETMFKRIKELEEENETLKKEYLSLNKKCEKLEEENEKLRKLCDSRYKYGSDMEGKYIVEHEKIRQAIEYIEKYSTAFNGEEEHLDKVYTILKGEENESR